MAIGQENEILNQFYADVAENEAIHTIWFHLMPTKSQ